MNETQKSKAPFPPDRTADTSTCAGVRMITIPLPPAPAENTTTMHKTILGIEGTAWNLSAGKGDRNRRPRRGDREVPASNWRHPPAGSSAAPRHPHRSACSDNSCLIFPLIGVNHRIAHPRGRAVNHNWSGVSWHRLPDPEKGHAWILINY